MSNFSTPFILPTNAYVRDLDILKNAVDDTAAYLHMTTGKSMHYCRVFIKKQLQQDGQFAYKDKTVRYLQRNELGDREEKTTTLSNYFAIIKKEKEILAPTGTTYLNPEVLTSLLSDYQGENVRLRSVAKKQKFAAENDGDLLLAALKDGEQDNAKRANNSVSGMHLSPSTPLYNKTAHSSLTSTCRTTAGYGNANNEKFISGNRHYYDFNVVLTNMTVLANNTDLEAIKAVIDKYALVVPSVEDVVSCVEHSTQLYWTYPDFMHNKNFKKIVSLIECLTPSQRASFVYVGDAFQLMRLNPEFMRGFLTELSERVVDLNLQDPMKYIYDVPESYRNLAAQLCPVEMVSVGHEYKKISPEGLQVFVPTCLHVRDTIAKYSDMIKAFWVTPNVPASVAHLPKSIRRNALVSDTDSTIFTVQEWVSWYCGGISFSLKAQQIAACMIFLTSETITHVLAMMSANIGVVEKKLHFIAMKNEYKFDVLVPTRIGKHYYANNSCQEGSIFPKWKMEIKGVGLKSSSAPPEINSDATKMMESIIDDFIKSDGKLSLYKYLSHVALVEESIFKSLSTSEMKYLRSGNLKDAASYSNKDPLKTPYAQHLMWNEVFGPKYGLMPEPPYAIYKVSTNTTKPKAMQDALLKMKDQELAKRLKAYMIRAEKKGIGTINVPEQVLQSFGIPEEIEAIMNTRKIVTDICRIYYLILETLGVYLYEKKIQRTVCDVFPQALLQAGESTKELLKADEGDELIGYEDDEDEEVEEE